MNFNRSLRLFVVFLIIFAWIFFGWPQIWPLGELGVNKVRIPPVIQEVKANPGLVFQNSSEVIVDGETSITMAAPVGTEVGDLLIAYISKDDDVNIDANGAWAEICNITSGSGNCLYVAWRIATTTNGEWTWTADSEDWLGYILRYTGHDETTPIHASDCGIDTTQYPIAPSVEFTDLAAGSLVLQVFGADDNDTPYTVPSPLEEIFNNTGSVDTGGAGGDKTTGVKWTSPTGFVDPGSIWTDEETIYDDNTNTRALSSNIPSDSWSDYLELTINAITCGRVRFNAHYDSIAVNEVSIDVYYADDWHNIYEGVFADRVWIEKEIGSTQTVTAMRYRWYNDLNSDYPSYFYEADFGEVISAEGTGYTGEATFTMNASEEWAAATVIIEAAASGTVSVSVSDGIITYGTMAAGTSKSTLQLSPVDTQTLTNDGDVTETFNIKGQNAPCPWTLAATAGTDQYVHQFCKATDVSCASPPTNYTALTTGYVELYTGVASSTTRQIDLRITTPTSTNCFTSQAVDITIQAVQ